MVLIINQRYTVSWSYFNRKDCELESKTKRKKEERNIVMKLIWVNREERRVEDKGTLKSRVEYRVQREREYINLSLRILTLNGIHRDTIWAAKDQKLDWSGGEDTLLGDIVTWKHACGTRIWTSSAIANRSCQPHNHKIAS